MLHDCFSLLVGCCSAAVAYRCFYSRELRRDFYGRPTLAEVVDFMHFRFSINTDVVELCNNEANGD